MNDCVGCGYCCKKAPCGLGYIEGEHCAHLSFDGERWRCALAADPVAYAALAMGEGCCSALNTERRKYEKR